MASAYYRKQPAAGFEEDPHDIDIKRPSMSDRADRSVVYRRRRHSRRCQTSCCWQIMGRPSLITQASGDHNDLDLEERRDLQTNWPAVNLRQFREARQRQKMDRIYSSLTRCVTCFRGQYCCINLPCGHATNCSQCKDVMMQCSKCYCPIRATREINVPPWDQALRFS